ncbi:MAG: SRPBCC family protein [Thermoleophilaceae bacterium]|nr:SRPBCC family protein [Thermoleophilaceae bacterium]
MAHFEHTVEIARPVGEVFAFVTEPSNYPRWQPSLVAVQPHRRGRLRPGSEVTEVRRFFGREVETGLHLHALRAARARDHREPAGAGALPGDLRARTERAGHALSLGGRVTRESGAPGRPARRPGDPRRARAQRRPPAGAARVWIARACLGGAGARECPRRCGLIGKGV